MQWADRIRTQAMTRIMTAFADQDMQEQGGTALMWPHQLMVEREIMDAEGTRWLYTTEIEVTVTRRQLQ